jgi:hypothetical protein
LAREDFRPAVAESGGRLQTDVELNEEIYPVVADIIILDVNRVTVTESMLEIDRAKNWLSVRAAIVRVHQNAVRVSVLV